MDLIRSKIVTNDRSTPAAIAIAASIAVSFGLIWFGEKLIINR